VFVSSALKFSANFCAVFTNTLTLFFRMPLRMGLKILHRKSRKELFTSTQNSRSLSYLLTMANYIFRLLGIPRKTLLSGKTENKKSHPSKHLSNIYYFSIPSYYTFYNLKLCQEKIIIISLIHRVRSTSLMLFSKQ